MPIAALVVLSGCPRSKSVSSQDHKQRVRIRSFSEPGPVRMLVAAEPYVFSAFDQGLDRWDLSSGQDLKLSAEHGLPGDRVEAMAYDPGRGWLWLVTDGGMTRYEVNVGTFAELPAPPSIYGLQDLEGAVLAPAGDGGLWLGHRRGLFYSTSDGRWTDTGITDPVSALMRSRDGWLWIGTSAGLVGRRPDGETAYFGDSKGCDLDKIRFIAGAPGGGPLIVGENKAGKQRIVLIMNETCSTYRASPDERWLSADRRADELVVLTSRRLYSVGMSEVGARSLSREGMRLVSVAVPPGASPPPRSPYFINALDVPVPVGAEVVATTPSEILVGTHSLGTARLATTGKSGRVTWLRRSLLVRDAAMLSVACMSAKDCFVATAARQAWRFRGDGFEPVDVAQSAVLAFVRSSSGDIYALARSTTNESEIVAYRNADGEWSLIADLTVKVPGRRPELTFARFSPSDLLWLGLRYEDGSNEQRPHGVALVDMSIGNVAYHHASRRDKFTKEGIMPIPIGVVDVAFLEEEEVWLASSEGAVLVRAEDVTVFTEADGLESELLRGVAVTSSGIVFIATGRGVSSYDGTEWTFPKALRWSVNDVEVGRDGRLWLATDRGVAVYDGARVRRLDQRRGLLQNEIDEIVIDHLDRIWARGSQGFTLITP